MAGRRILIVHGTEDRWTSPANSLDYARRADGVAESVDYVALKGAGHFMVRRVGLWNSLANGFILDAFAGSSGRDVQGGSRRVPQPPARVRRQPPGGAVMPDFPLGGLPGQPAVGRGRDSRPCWPCTFAVAVRQSRHSVIDTVWGLGFVVVAAISWFLSAGHGDDGRRLLLLALVAVWGIRLALHIGLRARGGHEDPRYVDMLSSAPGSRNVYALRKVYLPQGVILFFVSLTVQVGMFSTGSLGWLAWLGVPALGGRFRLRDGR